ncbi:uncharacterized protein LOC125683287 [Ostrea edulis]|uniref:uncharacterized protein LOC125683287 n=1 Tax=Ostrea edulis TaxID=37623 RepID=UPI0024AFE6B2|nr:uncharacterized protein LOC125683287 [Ostrea edulis]
MVKVKVTLMSASEPEIRRITLENDSDFSEFETRVSALFVESSGTFKFHWKDDENDLVVISTDEEFQEATKTIGDETLRIFIQRLKDCSNILAGRKVEFDNNPDVLKTEMTAEEFRPRRWERRYGLGRFGRGQRSLSPAPFMRRRRCQREVSEQQPSERRMWKRMHRENVDGFDKPWKNIHGHRSGCGYGRQQKRALRCNDGDHHQIPNDVCPENVGHRWSRDEKGSRRNHRRFARYLRQTLDSELMTYENCRSRVRNRENRWMKSCRRAKSAPTTRFYGRNRAGCGKILHGEGRRCRRSASVPPQERGRKPETLGMPVGKRSCRRHRHQMGKIVLKMTIKGMRQHDCESNAGLERKCFGRRCKSYRRRAMMIKEQNDDTSTIHQKYDREPEISELVETMTIDDSKSEEQKERDVCEKRERKRACKYRKSDEEDDVTDENTNSEKEKKKCRRRHRRKDESDGATGLQEDSTEGQEDTGGNGDPLEGKSQGRRRAKECQRSMRDETTARCKKNGDEHDFGILTLTVGMNGDLKIKPWKLARKLGRFLNQYSTGCQEDEPLGIRRGHEEFKQYRGRDSERQYRRMLRRQGRRREKARDWHPEYPSNHWSGIGAPGLKNAST